MDPAAYTLIGALGGVVITQVANFLLEEKRIAHRKEEELVASKRASVGTLQSRRREAYALFLAELDFYVAVNESRADQMLKYFYSAVIIASENVYTELGNLLQLAQKTGGNGEELRKAKGNVVKSIRKELSSSY